MVNSKEQASPRVSIIMGSQSDWPTLKFAAAVVEELGIAYEVKIVSAHRTPNRLYEYAADVEARGLQVIIAGAGGAAHLPGMVAAMTLRAILGMPLGATRLCDYAGMINILGSNEGVGPGDLHDPEVCLHLYNKAPAPRRKLGHFNVSANSEAELLSRLNRLHEMLYGCENSI